MRAEELEHKLGESVRAARIAHRLPQAELADRANVSLGALKHLEGGTGATTTTLVKVLHALDRDDWLDALAPPAPPFNPLDLLEARQKENRLAKQPQRVRRRASDRS